MSGPLMSISSSEVQNEFIKFKQFLLESTGAIMPEGIPSPMEAAMMQQPMEGMPPQGMGQGQGGPPPIPFPQQGAM